MARLTTEMMLNAQSAVLRARNHNTDIMEQVNTLYSRIKVFEAVVWFPKLQAIVNGTDSRGMNGSCRRVDIMTWCCAGRCLITLQYTKDILSKREQKNIPQITLITADDEKPWGRDEWHPAPNMGPMGIQSIDCEYEDALTMLYTVTRWADEIVLTPSESVTIG